MFFTFHYFFSSDTCALVKVRFVNFERMKLPEEILKHNLEEKRKYFSDICLEVERSDAEVQVCSLFLLLCFIIKRRPIQITFISFPGRVSTQAEGVYNQRLQNLAVTLDKVIVPPLLHCICHFIILGFNEVKKHYAFKILS